MDKIITKKTIIFIIIYRYRDTSFEPVVLINKEKKYGIRI